MTKLLNGKVVSTELLSRDTYNAMTRIVRRGTQEVKNSNNEQEKTEEVATPTVEEPKEEETQSIPEETKPEEEILETPAA